MTRCILVTGGAGFIGSHLVEELIKDTDNFVVVIDNGSTGDFNNLPTGPLPNLIIRNVDILDNRALKNVFDFCKYDTVFHLAAIPSVPKSLENPLASHDASATATLRMLEMSKKHGVKNFIYSASSSAYGDQDHYPQVETMLGKPKSPYAVGKYAGELYTNMYSKMSDMKTVALRYFNVFGPNQKADSPYSAVIPKFIRIMMADEIPTINGDGTITRDFTYVDNVVEANIKSMYAPVTVSGETFNIAAGGRTSLNDLVFKINKILGKNITPNYGPQLPGEIRHSFADISKARELLGYDPKVQIDEGLEKLINHITSTDS